MRFLAVLLALILLMISRMSAHPGPEDSLQAKPSRFDTTYIHDYKDLLSTRLYFLIQDTRCVIEVEGIGNIIYKPNLPFKVGIGGFYKWFGLGLAIGSPFHVHDEAKQGETESFDLRLNLYSSVFAVEGYLQSLKGFYTSNYSNAEGDPYLNPELRVSSLGASCYYILNNKRFSLRSVFVQNEWQKRSAGSFMGKFGFNLSSLKADSGFIPSAWIEDYGNDSTINFTKAANIAITLAPGYGYNLVFLKRCYAHASAFAGVLYNYLEGTSDLGTKSDNTFALLVSLRGAVGYVGKKFHIGFSAILPGIQPISSGKYNYFWDPPQYRFWVGTRFDAFRKKNKKM